MIENPKINRCLPDKAMDNIDHALGRPMWPLKETYRNKFAVDMVSSAAEKFKASPHWELFAVDKSGMGYFCVTEKGCKALSDYLKANDPHKAFVVTFWGYDTIVPAVSRGSAKYNLWLKISDCYSELTFGEFVKKARVERAS
jgi:hypothetical protein